MTTDLSNWEPTTGTDPRWNEGKAFYARADEIGFIEALYELTEREELFRNLEI
jgi:hypothetical protein